MNYNTVENFMKEIEFVNENKLYDDESNKKYKILLKIIEYYNIFINNDGHYEQFLKNEAIFIKKDENTFQYCNEIDEHLKEKQGALTEKTTDILTEKTTDTLIEKTADALTDLKTDLLAFKDEPDHSRYTQNEYFFEKPSLSNLLDKMEKKLDKIGAINIK